ncbi:MAG: hypothetical protein KJ674_05300 [Nanoarchaeota archaeon]|nr:hypothetical protein [Nanoarchaeota archaeon]
MALYELFLKIIFTIIIFIISSIPLYLAVKALKGKTSLLKTAIITLIAGIIIAAIQYAFKTFGGLIAFFVLIWIYHEVFRLKWLKAFLVWILHLIFIIIFYFIVNLLLISLLKISLI